MFELRVPLWELVARGSLVYLFLFAVFRVVLRRDAGSLGLADVLLVVLIADASQNAMAGGYESVPEGIVLMATIVGWNVLFDWLDYRFPALRRLLLPKPLVLVRDGVLQRRAMRRELVTTEELMAKLREHDASSLAEVELAIMESDGEISVKKRDPATAPPTAHQAAARHPVYGGNLGDWPACLRWLTP